MTQHILAKILILGIFLTVSAHADEAQGLLCEHLGANAEGRRMGSPEALRYRTNVLIYATSGMSLELKFTNIATHEVALLGEEYYTCQAQSELEAASNGPTVEITCKSRSQESRLTYWVDIFSGAPPTRIIYERNTTFPLGFTMMVDLTCRTMAFAEAKRLFDAL